jgi:H+-transporting ATPase
MGLATLQGLSQAEAQARLSRQGANEIPEKKRHPLQGFLKKFWNLSAWMIELIALLSFLIHKELDMWIALVLLVVNAVLGFVQEERASAAVAALRGRLQVMARVLRDGMWQSIPARELVVGDVVRVRSGDFVPADLRVVEGALQVDQSSLTGESQEVEKTVDALVYSGSVARSGEATALVAETGVRTMYGRTAQLVEMARPHLHVEAVIARVVRWLLVVVSVLVGITVLAATLEGQSLVHMLPVSLAILMNAVPVALPVMFTVSMALGSVELTRQGVIITQLSAVEDAATMDVLCADKTGTLTQNRLSVMRVAPQPGWSEADVVLAGARASNAANHDPIDVAFLEEARVRALPLQDDNVLRFVPFSAATRRTEALVSSKGREFLCMKGALRTLSEATSLDETVLARLESQVNNDAAKGWRALAVASSEQGGPLRFMGLVYLFDDLRTDSASLVGQLKALGISVKMLTGDALPVAGEVASRLGMGRIVRATELRSLATAEDLRAAALAEGVDGFAEVFPEDKFTVVKSLQAAGHVVGMTGDGVNDAPALRQAEVGIAVSGATDVAKGAARAVLTTEGLANIIDMVKTGRAIYQRVLTWIIYKVSQTLLKAGFVVVSFLAMGKFAISLLGIVLLVFMNDFMMISLATDKVRPSPQPETWAIEPQLKVSLILGLCMLGEGLGLLAIGTHYYGMANADGRLLMLGFEILAAFALFAVLSMRERRRFWESRPSAVLVAAVLGDMMLAVGVGLLGLAEMKPLPLSDIASIFALAGFLVLIPNDWLKARLMARALRANAVPDSGRSNPGHDA